MVLGNWHKRFVKKSVERGGGRSIKKKITEVFNVDNVTANDVIQINQHRKEKKNLNSI